MKRKPAALDFLSASPQGTKRLAASLASLVRPDTVLALVGELGSGKTTFIKGLAQGLGIKVPVTSPSFVIVKEYSGRLPLFHFDFYRLKKAAELGWENFAEYLDKKGVLVLEWADRLPQVLPRHHLRLEFVWLGPQQRLIKFRARGKTEQGIIKYLREKNGPALVKGS